jgi:hypothetical protein
VVFLHFHWRDHEKRLKAGYIVAAKDFVQAIEGKRSQRGDLQCAKSCLEVLQQETFRSTDFRYRSMHDVRHAHDSPGAMICVEERQ